VSARQDFRSHSLTGVADISLRPAGSGAPACPDLELILKYAIIKILLAKREAFLRFSWL
jgi:hypothetical protein